MDEDRDGVVRMEEFIQNCRIEKNQAKKIFYALDSDGNRMIPIPEYLRVWGRWARSDQKPAEQRMDHLEKKLHKNDLASQLLKYDTNDDSRLDRNEILQLLKSADTNSDGVLDRNELNALGHK